ncbi:MAG TPA: UbiX family flavin prenyltransferase [Chloroflexota bacterium]|nr:UbiX family flavin prenyltransferase [Chloroflexota bacterium]
MRIVVGMSGSSGSVYGIRLLETLSQLPHIETELVMSPSADLNIREETAWDPEDVKKLATRVHDWKDVGATISSGSYKHDGMIVAPCSANSLAGIAYGVNANNLLLRAADVTLKERRRLVIMFRETPLHRGHIKAMLEATENGAIIMPPVPSFYHHPQSIDEIINHSVARALDLLNVEHNLSRRWAGLGQMLVESKH